MRTLRHFRWWRNGAAVCLALLVMLGISLVQSGKGVPPFDFSAAFYRQNVIDPTKILNRVDGTSPVSVVDNSNKDPNRRNIRVRETTGGFDHEGNVLFYNIFGMAMPSTFTNDDAGRTAL